MQLPSEFTDSKPWLTALSERTAIAAAPAVYVLLRSQPFGRLFGESRILYIGHTRQLGGSSQSCRLRIYCYPNGAHSHELRNRAKQVLDAGGEIMFHWHHLPTKTDAQAEEARLLQRHLALHGELPPFNSRC